MANKWKGFTEEDIRSLTNIQPTLPDEKVIIVSVNKRVSRQNRHYIRNNMAREQILRGLHTTDIPEEAKLSIPQTVKEEETEDSNTSNTEDVKGNQTLVCSYTDNQDYRNGSSSLRSNDVKMCLNSNKFLSKPLLNTDADQDTLLEFQARQKLMEEQNRQRKEKLKKALVDRSKKTYEEVQRLSQIEEEMKKLDSHLSCDIAILRNQIELASVDFMEAQKRFDRAEREYLDAKLTLFNKKEHKELLVSHLCTIIEQNELRKSNRLSELMEMLELKNDEEVESKNSQYERMG